MFPRTHARLFAALLLVTLGLLIAERPASATFTPTFTYTGQLLVGGSPVSGTYDFQFGLYTSGGTQVGSTITVTSVSVADGVFYVQLAFPQSSFNGQTLYLQTAYALHPASTYTTQSPRKIVTTTGYAYYAGSSASTQSLQGNFVSAAAPSAGQVLTWQTSGSKWVPMSLPPASLPLPYSASASSSSPLLSLTNSGSGSGVMGTNSGNGNYGLLGGVETYTGNNYPVGVFGNDTSSFGFGVYGNSASGYGMVGNSTSFAGILGISSSSGLDENGSRAGVYGESGSGDGVYGYSESGPGISAEGFGTTVSNPALLVTNDSSSGIAIYSTNNSSDANLVITNGGTGDLIKAFNGGNNLNFEVTAGGNLTIAGTLTAATKNFRIDDPLNPATMNLAHASIESDEMTDIYSGNVHLSKDGSAWVQMPHWFQALNTDFRYNLTCIGGFAPVYVAKEIASNKFQIAGGKPGMKVSWQVTGVRHDTFALANPLQVEQEKTEAEHIQYQNREAASQPKAIGIGYAQQQKMQAKN